MVLSKFRLLLLSTFIITAYTLSAQTPDVTIRLYDEDIYFPDSEIELYITIQNETPETQRFRLADDRAYNVEFLIYDDQGRRIEPEGDVIIEGGVNQVYYRTISLEPGDYFSFVETLSETIQLERPGLYSVSVAFYPELKGLSRQAAIHSNTITLSIRPGETPEERTEERFQAIAVRELQRQQLSPDDTVRYLLDARRESNWDRFFLYLNLEKLYRQEPDRDRRYRREMSEAEQRERLDEFRQELIEQSDPRDTGLTVVPDSYRIERTTYTPTEGTVVAELHFDFDRYRERKRYIYRLERRNGFWEIIGYDVTNLPNEALTP